MKPSEKLLIQERYSAMFLSACRSVLSAKKTRNQAWLARAGGIAPKTLSRFLGRETLSMDKENMLALARFLLSDTASGALEAGDKKQLKAFLKEFEHTDKAADEELNHKIERFLLENQDIALVVYLLCCNDAGLSAKELFALGEDARLILQKFLKNKWVEEREQRFHAVQKTFVIKKGLLLQRAACAFIQRMNPEHWDDPSKLHNYFYFYTESLNKAGMKKITDILVDSSRKIEAIIADSQMRGDLPCSMILFQDLLKKV